MRLDLFEELAPLCPRCLHGGQTEAPLVVAERIEMRGGVLWFGVLHCSNRECWMEFPVIDGIPVIVPDVPVYLNNSRSQVLARSDLPAVLQGVIGDSLGPNGEFDAVRQHLSLYAGSHFADWTAEGGMSAVADVAGQGLALLGPAGAGVAVDLGCSVGRGVWELAARTGGPALGGDLNFSMLRLAQTLMLEGRASFGLRRIGTVYDQVEITLPDALADARVDFWAVDCMAAPFQSGSIATLTALNLLDCIAGPAQLLAEMGRILAPGGGALVTTPYDWAPTATDPAQWFGGHSQRASLAGAAEPVLRATLEQAGLSVIAEADDVSWRLRMHARSEMTYRLHMVACRRAA